MMKISHLANFVMMIVGGAVQEAACAVRRKLEARIAKGHSRSDA
jgi:hypothetical protein